MSVKIMAQVWESSQARLGELLVLLAIADFADDDGIAYPTIKMLSRKTRLSERETQYVVAALITKRELSVEYRQNRTNRFTVLLAQRPLFTESTGNGGVQGLHPPQGLHPRQEVEQNVSLPQSPVEGCEDCTPAKIAPGAICDPLPLTSPLRLPSSLPSPRSRHKQDPPVMPPRKGGRVYSEAHWTEFQESYPHRLGKVLDLETTKKLFVRLSLSDQALLAPAARNYAEALTLQGLKAKDAKRFLRTRSGHEPWREWIEPAPGAMPRCAWTIDLKGTRCDRPVEPQQGTSYKLCHKHLINRLDLDRKIAEAYGKAAGPSTGAIMPVSKAAKMG